MSMATGEAGILQLKLETTLALVLGQNTTIKSPLSYSYQEKLKTSQNYVFLNLKKYSKFETNFEKSKKETKSKNKFLLKFYKKS